MFVPNYKITEGKLGLFIFDLARGEEEVRKRLIRVFTERGTFSIDDFPKELQDNWSYIYQFMTSEPSSTYESAYKNSLKNKRNKTCSIIVHKIIILYEEMKRHNLLNIS